MPTFTYKSLSSPGSAAIDAPDRASALRELTRRGVVPTSIESVRTSPAAAAASEFAAKPRTGNPASDSAAAPQPAAGAINSSVFSGVSRSEMAMLIRELATGLAAGLPLVPSLRTIERQTKKPRQRAMMNHLITQVEQGRSLADAATAWGKPFGDLTINMMRAGEASGRLPEVLTQAANLLDRDLKLRRSVMGATLYPLILLVLISLAVVIVVTLIVPSVLKNLPGGAVLPLPTRIVQGLAAFVAGYWWAIILAVVLATFGWIRLYADAAFRLAFDRALLHIPILGRLLRDVAVARFTRTLGTLTNAGIPILTSLRVTKGTLGNKAMEQVVERVCEQITSGKTIAEPMEQSGYFPPMLVQIVNMGERSGKLDEMLGQAAGAFEDRTETSLKLFTTALPPLLVVILACVVGFIVMSILLPLLDAQEAIR
jgi:type II secretory pathway component PulF